MKFMWVATIAIALCAVGLICLAFIFLHTALLDFAGGKGDSIDIINVVQSIALSMLAFVCIAWSAINMDRLLDKHSDSNGHTPLPWPFDIRNQTTRKDYWITIREVDNE